MAEFIESGFWQAILVLVGVGVITSIIGIVIRKINTVLGAIITWIPSIIIFFYIWQIRHGVGWLIFGIMSIISFVCIVISALLGKKANKVVANIAAKAPIDEFLPHVVEGMLKEMSLPMMIDPDTRLDSITALSGGKLLFTNTLVNVDAEQTFLPEATLGMRNNLLTIVKGDSFAALREKGVTFVYEYMDKDQRGQVDVFEFTPSDY